MIIKKTLVALLAAISLAVFAQGQLPSPNIQTAAPGTNTTQAASTAFVQAALASQGITLPGANAIEIGNSTTASFVLTVDANGEVAIAKVNQVQFFGGANMTGGSHIVAAFNYALTGAAGKTNALAIGSENSTGVTAGAVTNAYAALNTSNGMTSGTSIGTWIGSYSSPTNVASGATITQEEGFRHALLPSTMLGTVTASYAFHNMDSSGVTGAATRYSFVNDDAGAPNKSKNPWIDSSFQAFTPTNGGTTTIPPLVGLIVLNGGGTIASNNITLPASTAMTDGQEITFFVVTAISSVTYTSSGATPLGLPSALTASSFFRIKYAAAGPYWLRVG